MAQQDEAFRYSVDERLVAPESRFEAIDGQVRYVSPADREHASRHSKLAALLEACSAEGYDVAVDMLTRTSETSDFAPDVSVYPIAPDPETGRRQLEELAFEVVSTETIAHAQAKALELQRRGVRRVFAIDAERGRVLELSRATGSFEILDSAAPIVDPALGAPLELSALLDRAKVDDALGQALLRKKTGVIEAALREREAKGQAEGEAIGRAQGEALGRLNAKRETLIALLQSRGLALSTAAMEHVAAATDESLLDRWLLDAAQGRKAAALLDD